MLLLDKASTQFAQPWAPDQVHQSTMQPASDWVIDEIVVDSNKHLGTTGGQLWPAAQRCLEYISNSVAELGLNEPGLNILELGAGLGYLGLNLARNLPGARTVCLTEQATGGALDWLNHNITKNAHLPNMKHVAALECDWSDFEPGGKALVAALNQVGGSCVQGTSAARGAAGDARSPECTTEPADDGQGAGQKVADLVQLLNTPWDFIVGSDLIYNHVGSKLLPHVIKTLSRPHTITLYCHSRHRFDHLDMEFLEQVEQCGLNCVEVKEPWADTPPPSPPPLTELFPELRIAVYRISLNDSGVTTDK